MDIRIGIVGCGGIARAHANAWKTHGATIAAVYDVNRDAAGAFASELGASTTVPASLDKMAAMELTAVSVCTPPGTHMDVCTPFLATHTPLLCEKPLEADTNAADALASAVRESDTLFMAAFCHRWHPAVVKLKQVIDSGDLGTPLLFRNIFSGRFELAGNHRAQRELSGGGAMIDTSTHSVDLFRFLIGDPDTVEASTGNVDQNVDVEDFGRISLSHKGKCFGEILACCSVGVGLAQLEIHGTKGLVMVEFFGAPPLKVMKAGSGAWEEIDCTDLPDRFVAETGHFLDCIRTGKTPQVTAEDGRIASRILSAAYESAASGQRITL